MRRILVLGFVVVAVALSGCSMIPGSSDSIEGELSAATGGGEINETILLESHLEANRDSPVQLSHRNGNRSTVYVMRGNDTYRIGDNTTSWTSESLTLTDNPVGGADYGVRYDETSAGDGTGTFGLSVRLSSVELEYSGTVERNGTELFELSVVGTKGMGQLVGHYTGTVLVDEGGRVHRMAGQIGDNESSADPYVYDYDWSVDSVPKPSWFDAVPRGTATLTDDNRTLRVQITGSTAVPAGTELEFYTGETYQVTLDSSLESGESLYVALADTDDGRQPVTARQPFESDNRVSLSGEDDDFSQLYGSAQLQGTVTLDNGKTVDLLFRVR